MRRFFLLLLSLWTLPVMAASDFQTANTAYAEGRFDDARGGYERLVSSGDYSANLFYNLGNTLYRLKQNGRAVLAYKRALTLDPGHSAAAANLALVQEAAGSRVPAEPGWYRYYPRLGLDAWTWIATIAAWIFLFAAAVRLLGLAGVRRPDFLAVLALLVFLWSLPALGRETLRENSAVVLSATSARSAPTTGGEAAATLPAGSVVRLLATRGDWIYAEMPDARKLWLPAAEVEAVRL